MRATQRRRHIGLIRELLRDPHRFGFFQAVRIVERWLLRRGAPPGQLVVDRLRFPNSSSLAFPPSEIAAISGHDADGRDLSWYGDADTRAVSVCTGKGPADRDEEVGLDTADEALRKIERIALTPAFFGLLGAQGALPHYFTEAVLDRESNSRDRGVRAFLDIFSTRATALFYGAWKKYRLPVRHELEPDHHYLPLLLALGGLGHPALRNRLCDGDGGIPDESLGRHAAALGKRPVSSAQLQSVLSEYFRLTVRIESFVGNWYPVPPQHWTRLDCDGAILGGGARVGERVWQRNLRMRVWIGPLDRRSFHEFLPDRARARALGRWIALLMGPGYEYEVRVVLRKENVSGCTLNDAAGARLGYDTFLCTRAVLVDRDEMAYDLECPRLWREHTHSAT